MRIDRRMTFIVTPMGSAGDVQPLVWLGRGLQAAGHRVVVVAQELVAEMPRRAGLRTVTYGSSAEQEELIRHPHLWHPRKGFELLAAWVPRWAREGMPLIRGEVVAGETVFIGGALAFGARILAEALDVPMVTVHLQPSVFMSVEEPPVAMARGEWLQGAPRWMRRGLMGLTHMHVDRRLKGPVNALRGEANGKKKLPVRGIMKSWWNSPDGVVCLFPEWYAVKASDWPKQAVLTRFPLYDEAGVREVDAQLEEFLSAGDAPVVITPGSANVQAKKFLGEAVAGVKRMRRRGGRDHPEFRAFADVAGGGDSGGVCAVQPGVSRGGGGDPSWGDRHDSAVFLAAGVPQLIMPMAHDQPDNAARVKRMGVGDYVYPRMFKWQRVAGMVERLVKSEEVRASCALVKRKMADQMGADEVVRVVSEMGERGLRVREINGPGVVV